MELRRPGQPDRPRGALDRGLAVGAALVLFALLVAPAGGVDLGPGAVRPATAPPHGTPAPTGRGVPPLAMPAAYGTGTILATEDLTSGQVVPGPAAPAVQNGAEEAVYDNQTGNVYVRGVGGDALSVINVSDERVIADVRLPSTVVVSYVPSVAVDTATGYIYVANANENNVSIIDGATNQVTGSIAIGAGPGGLLYDPANGQLYVSNSFADNVTVIDPARNQTVGSVVTGYGPAAMLLDPTLDRLFVANHGSNNVTVIDTSTDKWIGTIPVGNDPVALALDTRDGYVDVIGDNVTVVNATTLAVVRSVDAGGEGGVYVPSLDRLYVLDYQSVSIIGQTTNTVVDTVPTVYGTSFGGITYDPLTNTVYVAGLGNYSNAVTIFNATSGASSVNVTTGGVGFATAELWLPSAGEVWVVNGGNSEYQTSVTVLDGWTGGFTASICLDTAPTSVAYDASNGDLYVSDQLNARMLWANGSTDAQIGATPVSLAASGWPNGPTAMAYDSWNHEVYITTGAIVVVLGPDQTLLATIPLGHGPFIDDSDAAMSLVFDPVNGYVFAGTDFGNVTVINGSTNQVIGALVLREGSPIEGLAVDPATNELFVADPFLNATTVWGATNLTELATIPVGLEPDSVAFDPVNQTVVCDNSMSGNFSVISAVTLRNMGFVNPPESGPLVYVSSVNSFYLVVGASLYAINATTYATIPGSPLAMGFTSAISGVAFDPANDRLFVVSQGNGTLSMVGLGVPTYPITFEESGLPADTVWSVIVNGDTQTGGGLSLTFFEPDGSYGYSIQPVVGYSSNLSAGTWVELGNTGTIQVGFVAISAEEEEYPVTFTESGLPIGTAWSVTLDGAQETSSGPMVQFTEPNGSYLFGVGGPLGYTAEPTSGTVAVTGGPQGRGIDFGASTLPLSASLTLDSTEVTEGVAVVVTTHVTGGTPPYDYVYSGLPANCTTAPTSTLGCVPTFAGSYDLTVNVTDADGRSALASATLTVIAGSSLPGTRTVGGSVPIWEWLAAAGGVAALLVLIVVVRRRQI